MKTIMIVEDDTAIRETLMELLESEGYNVISSEHGERALGILAQNPQVDLVLLDLSMPIMDGKTFLKEVKIRHPELNAMPILIMTAAGPGDLPMDFNRNMILRKPLDVDILIEKIEKVV